MLLGPLVLGLAAATAAVPMPATLMDTAPLAGPAPPLEGFFGLLIVLHWSSALEEVAGAGI